MQPALRGPGEQVSALPRIPPIADPDERQRELLAKTPPAPDGTPLNVFRTFAHRPELLRRVNALGGYFPRASELDLRTRELAILRVAARTRSSYEEGQHRVIAAAGGVDQAEIDVAADPRRTHDWAPRDLAVLALVDELVADHVVSDATWHALDGHYSDPQRLELLTLVGFYVLIAGMLNTIGVELDPSVAERL